MEPGPLASNEPEMLRIQERNAFFESLAPAAKESFLRALEAASERGVDQEAAWQEAVVAAETTYPPDLHHEPALADENL